MPADMTTKIVNSIRGFHLCKMQVQFPPLQIKEISEEFHYLLKSTILIKWHFLDGKIN